MAIQFGKLCTAILREHFGEVVQKVSAELQWGPRTLHLIVSATGLPIKTVKKALSVLIQYGFVTYERGKLPTVAEYKFLPDKVLLLLRYPRYLTLIQNRLSDESRLLVEEILRSGYDTTTNVILRASERIKEGKTTVMNSSLQNLKDKFLDLIHKQYLMRYPAPAEDDPTICVPQLVVKESELFWPPEINMTNLSLLSQGHKAEDPGDSGVYWRINFDRFHQDLRDDIMIKAMERRFDEHAGQLMKELLRLMYLRTDTWAAESNPVPIVEIKDAVNKNLDNNYLSSYIDQYLKIMEDSSKFIKKSESSSGLVKVNLATAIYELSCNAIDNIVNQRFGGKAARIFRLVRAKKFMEQDQIQQLAMIPDKEAKYLTYKLLQENFLQIQELRKPTMGSGLNKSFFLFHVDLNQVAHMVTETCHKALFNTIARHHHEHAENKRLVEKQERIEDIAQSMRDQGTDEEQIKALVDEWLSPPERNLLETVEAVVKKLQLAELQIDETLFLMQLFSYYQNSTTAERNKPQTNR